MRRITRDKLRGKPLDYDCKRAKTAYEGAPNGVGVYACYGYYDMMTDEPTDECANCGAFERNVSDSWESLVKAIKFASEEL